MHSVNLAKFSLRTDLVVELCDDTIKSTSYKFRNGEVTKSTKKENNEKYVTISFDDVTDKDNFLEVEKVFVKELKKFIEPLKLKEKDTVLIIGLGNNNSTPDSLGPLVVDNILVTRYLFKIGDVEEGYQCVCSFKPSVTGTTGIETIDMINSVVEASKAKCIIIIDSLAASSVNKVDKAIQITNTGIHPGSGVSNNRGEVSEKTLKRPVIAIGVPTIVEVNTIVADTLIKLDKYFDKKDKNNKILGEIGNLEKEEIKQLIEEIIPGEYNFMVTPKEIDFVMEKLGLLIGNGINKTLHKNFIRQKN